MHNFMLNLLQQKSLRSNILEARQTMEIFVVTISSHIISFCFLPIFAQLRKTKIGRFKAEELAVTGKKIFDYLKRKDFWSRSKKIPILLITAEPVSCLQRYFGDHEDLYISFLFHFSLVTDNAKPACLDCVNSNIYSCILSLLKLHRNFIASVRKFLWE